MAQYGLTVNTDTQEVEFQSPAAAKPNLGYQLITIAPHRIVLKYLDYGIGVPSEMAQR